MSQSSWAPVRLKVLVNRPKPVGTDAVPFLPWPLAAALAGVGAAVAGWLIVAGVVLACWFTVMAMPLSDMLTFGTQLWLLALGAPAAVGTDVLTVMPLGLTFFAVWLNARLGIVAVRQAVLAHPDVTEPRGRLALAAPVVAIAMAAFVAGTAIMVVVTGRHDIWVSACVGAAVVSFIGLAWAGLRGTGLADFGTMEPRLRRVAAGALGGLLALAAVGAVVIGLAVLFGWTRIGALDAGLAPDGVGVAVLAVIAVAWWPNALAWATSWALGGGFFVGLGSSVSLSGTQLGMLPSIPMLGALPAPGVTPPAMELWMLSGVLAGCISAVCAGAWRPPAGLVGRTLTAVGAALVACAAFMGVAAVSGGDLGTLRLIGIGPDLTGLLVVAPAIMVLSAALASVILWLLPDRAPHEVVQAEGMDDAPGR